LTRQAWGYLLDDISHKLQASNEY